MFLKISRWLEITERERSKLLLYVKNSQELGSNPFLYIAPVIPRPLPGEVVGGEHFVLANLLKSISGSSSQAGSAREPKAEIAEGALISFVRPNQSCHNPIPNPTRMADPNRVRARDYIL